MSDVAVVVMIVALALFVAGLVLPFVLSRVDRAREPERADMEVGDGASLDVVIPAYLEASVVGLSVRRLITQLAAWPGPARVLVVASDDATADAAAGAGAVVLRTEPRGKAAAVNAGVYASNADVIVLTDANCELGPDAWPARLQGALVGGDLLSARKSETGARESAFWRYEDAVKRSLGADGPTMSVAGEFLAFRRVDFTPLPASCLTDDLTMARDFAVRGLRVRIAPGIQTSEPPSEGRDQWERRIRIAAGVWTDALPQWRVLSTVPAGRQFLAHKGYRMTVGVVAFWTAVSAASLTFSPWSELTRDCSSWSS